MHTATIKFKGVSPYSQSKYIPEEKKRGESHDEFEKRTWIQRMEVDDGGMVVLSPMALKRSLEDAATFSGMKIKGKGNSTYTKRLLAGIMVTDLIPIGKKKDIIGEWFHVPSNGERGGPKRVMKRFPMIKNWGGAAEIMVLDD